MRQIVPLVIALLAAACAPSNAMMDPIPTTTTVSIAESTTTSTTTTTTTVPAATEMFAATTTPVPFRVTSPAFEDEGVIPVEHTCDGVDASPPLEVAGLPSETESVVVTMEDPETAVGAWIHWLVFDVAAQPTDLKVPAGAEGRGTMGINSWHVTGYKGPCPPAGEEHRYFFTVYALSDTLDLPAGVDSAAVRAAMQPHLISSAELMGRYAR